MPYSDKVSQRLQAMTTAQRERALKRDEETLISILRGAKLSLRIITPTTTHDIGDEPRTTIRVHEESFFRRVLTETSLGLAETYMSGGWTLEEGSLEDLMLALVQSRLDVTLRLDLKTTLQMAALRARHALQGTRSNVRAHYDIGDDLYASFLDETRGYTCGYQKDPNDSNQQLQENKYERICQKLRLAPNETFFDIGCGYGGLMIHAAQRYGVIAHGVTNSVDHQRFAAQRIKALNLQGRVHVRLADLQEASGSYDKVASCGVLEHLMPHEHKDFIKTLRRLLRPQGLGLLHTIGCITASNTHDPFIQKYIFPGSTQNPLSLLSSLLERAELAIFDVENIARHYAPTTRRWLEDFRKNQHTLDPVRYPPSFQRMWEYYLALCIAGATASDGAVWQILFTNDYRAARPMLRV